MKIFETLILFYQRISQKLYEIQTLLQWNTNRNLQTLYSRVSFRMILSDLKWLSEIFNDMKHRAASLWQRSFLAS